MDRTAAELFLASLFVEVTPERLAVLRNAAKNARSWEGLQCALEAHGVLSLFLRNLERGGIELPPAIAPLLQAKGGSQRDDDQRSRLSLQRFLAAAARERVEVTLVGGSTLFLDLYPEPLRRAGELEFLVAPEHLARALSAGEQAGLLLDESALPAWWYRRTRATMPLAPSSSMLRGIRLRTHLHHPSLLLTTREPELLARRKRVPFEGHPLHLLDPIDGLLELSVHLATHAGDALVSGRRHLLEAACSERHSLRLDQVLDLRTHIERRHAELAVADVLARAREWSAEPALRGVLECVQMGLGFLPGAREWARQLAQGLANAPTHAGCALFRPDPIERLPAWLRPKDAFLARRYALSTASPRALRLARARHLAELAGAGAMAALGLPLALILRRLARTSRRCAWNEAQMPQRRSEVTDSWRSAARVEQQKPIAPRTISLLPREEGATRFPDRYLG
jgi:hypothetical protein